MHALGTLLPMMEWTSFSSTARTSLAGRGERNGVSTSSSRLHAATRKHRARTNHRTGAQLSGVAHWHVPSGARGVAGGRGGHGPLVGTFRAVHATFPPCRAMDKCLLTLQMSVGWSGLNSLISGSITTLTPVKDGPIGLQAVKPSLLRFRTDLFLNRLLFYKI